MHIVVSSCCIILLKDFAKDDKIEDRHCISPLQMPVIPTFVGWFALSSCEIFLSLNHLTKKNEISI